MPDSRPIGVFDSGMGGLTVLSELVRELPNEHFVYLGDTARVPYGSRSQRTVQRYSEEAAARLLKEDIKYLVIACNTATAHAGELLTTKLRVPVLGVIEPGVEALLAQTKNGRVGIIGTRATVKSAAYEKAIRARTSDIRAYSKACPLFVPLVEEGWTDKRITHMIIQEYLSELVREEIDAVVLGCTHYPLLKQAIAAEFPSLILVDSSVETAKAVKGGLQAQSLCAPDDQKGAVRIMLTDVTDQMDSLEKLFFGLAFTAVEEIRLGD